MGNKKGIKKSIKKGISIASFPIRRVRGIVACKVNREKKAITQKLQTSKDNHNIKLGLAENLYRALRDFDSKLWDTRYRPIDKPGLIKCIEVILNVVDNVLENELYKNKDKGAIHYLQKLKSCFNDLKTALSTGSGASLELHVEKFVRTMKTLRPPSSVYSLVNILIEANYKDTVGKLVKRMGAKWTKNYTRAICSESSETFNDTPENAEDD